MTGDSVMKEISPRIPHTIGREDMTKLCKSRVLASTSPHAVGPQTHRSN